MTYDEMKSALQMMDTAESRLEMVMDFGAHAPSVPDGAVCADIHGCASFVQICRVGDMYYGRADSALVRGIVTIITAMVSNHTVDEIRKMDISGEFASLGLNLGTGRLGGVDSMIRFLKNL